MRLAVEVNRTGQPMTEEQLYDEAFRQIGAAPLEAGETQPKRRPERPGNSAKRQRNRDARLKQAAEMNGFASIDKLARALRDGTHIVIEK